MIVRGLCKSYGRHSVFADICFEMAGGEIIGLVGPNGAGKTTLLLSMMGFLRTDGGEVNILGQRVRCGVAPQGVGFIPDRPEFYGFHTAMAHLRHAAALLNKPASGPQMENILKRAGLAAAADRKISKYSRGMVQRLAWAQTMLAEPPVLLLDEPTAALDAVGVMELREFVRQTAQSGTAILFSSHSLSEVEKLCTRVLFLVNGALSAWDAAREPEFSRYEIELHPASERNFDALAAFAEDIVAEEQRVRFRLKGAHTVNQIIKMLDECGLDVVQIAEISPSLEEAFVQRLERRQ